MHNIASYQEGYTDGYNDGKEMTKKTIIKSLYDFMREHKNDDLKEFIEDVLIEV